MAEFFILVKNFIRFLIESKDSKFLKSSKGRLLFTFVSIILDLILALIKNPSLLQNLFNDEKEDLVSHCKSPYRSKYNLLEKPSALFCHEALAQLCVSKTHLTNSVHG